MAFSGMDMEVVPDNGLEFDQQKIRHFTTQKEVRLTTTFSDPKLLKPRSDHEKGFGKLYDWMKIVRYAMCTNKSCVSFLDPDLKNDSAPYTSVHIVDIKQVLEFSPIESLEWVNETYVPTTDGYVPNEYQDDTSYWMKTLYVSVL
ncbi:unnamed protein product [Orchesella dallaii]|uniref:Uncharacterized protein n=1 Tax=Orchesella dallaii TaxID=48710 RepID=A0ABP1PMI8_9HEXA